MEEKKDIKRLYEYVNSMDLTSEEEEELRYSDEYKTLAFAYHNSFGDYNPKFINKKEEIILFF